jgi:phosphatidylserine synthase
VARLVYFTVRGFHRPNFLGAPTPQSALAVGLLVLFADVPGFLGTQPFLLLAGSLLVAVLMVTPIPFPKIRRGSPLRRAMAVTGAAFIVAILPLQFRPPRGSPLYFLSLAAAVVTAGGLLAYYLLGPRSVPASAATAGGPLGPH